MFTGLAAAMGHLVKDFHERNCSSGDDDNNEILTECEPLIQNYSSPHCAESERLTVELSVETLQTLVETDKNINDSSNI